MTVSYDRHGSVALIIIDDGKANAASVGLLDVLSEALDQAEAERSAVVLAGRPGVFCGGFDLKIMKGADEAERHAMLDRGARMTLRLFTFQAPLVIASTGHALALGAVWLLCGDTRIGERCDHRYGLNETSLGLQLPVYASETARSRLQPSHLFAAAVQAKIYDPEGAVLAGFLDELTDGNKAVDLAIERAAALASLPREAYVGNKLKIRADAAERMCPGF